MFPSRTVFPAGDGEAILAAKQAACLETALAQRDQIRRKQEYASCLAAVDREFDEAVLESVRLAIEQDARQSCETRKTLHNETEQYLCYLQNVNRERRLAEEERDRIIEENNRNENERMFGKSCLVQRQKREFAKTVFAERWKQIEDNRKRREQEYAWQFRDAVLEHENVAAALQKDREELQRKFVEQKMYGNALLMQAEEVNVKKVSKKKKNG